MVKPPVDYSPKVAPKNPGNTTLLKDVNMVAKQIKHLDPTSFNVVVLNLLNTFGH